ncbi:uncharacterized protein LOC101455277 [Ceratitis capitata]|uniref:uncharacterized protein LOC101455277 n=1 Tax=Ceratitis capitata TaxID=7213 RepID=UPI000329F3B1|nr:uncharacterized protein LOC101455277 [Ceratitis capitata]
MDVNKKILIRLVQSVEKYPCLYDNTLKEYSKREYTERAWIEVAEELSSTPDVVREKWKVVRSVFVRRLKQLHMGELIKPYYLHEYMQFVVPFLQKPWDPERRTKCQLEESERRLALKNKEKIDNNINRSSTPDYSDVVYDEENLYANYLEDITEQPQTKSAKKRKRRTHSEDIYDTSGSSEHQFTKLAAPVNRLQINQVSSDANRIEDDEPTGDENCKRMFLLSLMPDLEDLNISQMRKFKTTVIGLINDIFQNK